MNDRAGLPTPKYVFIGGYMHSGTTLLGEIIGNLSSTFRSPHETKFLEFLPRYRQLYPDLRNEHQHSAFRDLCRHLLIEGFNSALLSLPPSAKLAEANTPQLGSTKARFESAPERHEHLYFFLREVDRLLAEHGSTTFVEPTGTNIFAYQELAASGEDVYLIDITRDPRDVLASKKSRRATVFTERYRPEQQQRKHYEKSFDAFWDTASWRSFVRAGESGSIALDNRYLHLRYEDLVVSPEDELSRIAELIGDKHLLAKTLNIRTSNSADMATTRSGVDAQSVGRWIKILSRGEAAVCTSIARSEMISLNYVPIGPRFHPSAAKPLAHAIVEPLVRIYRRSRLMGPAGAWVLCRNYAMRVRRSRGKT